MGVKGDEFEDQTIGIPRPRAPISPAKKAAGWPAAPPSPRPSTDERPTPPPAAFGPSSGPGPAEDPMGTLMPPRVAPTPARPRSGRAFAPAPDPGPLRDAFGTELDRVPVVPRPAESHWSGGGPSSPSAPYNPGWDEPSPMGGNPADASVSPPSWAGEGPGTLPPVPRPRPVPSRPRPESRTPAEFDGEASAHAPFAGRNPRGPAPAQADEFRTIGIGSGLEIGNPEKVFVLQYAVGKRPWRDLEAIEPGWHPVGRSSFRQAGPAAEFLADEHFRVVTEDDRVFVEPGETINGVYLKLEKRRPFELTPGTRFQVAQHVIEFRGADDPAPGQPGLNVGGESFRTSRLEPLAYLDFLGPDGSPSARFPMTKPEGTLIGRSGDIVLPEASGVSRSHARVFLQGARFFVEDLGSTNGTFARVDDRVPIRPGGPLDALSGDVLLVGAVFVRVVES